METRTRQNITVVYSWKFRLSILSHAIIHNQKSRTIFSTYRNNWNEFPFFLVESNLTIFWFRLIFLSPCAKFFGA